MEVIEKTYRILVVEDNPGDFLLISDCLREQMMGVDIAEAASFRELRELISNNESAYDVVLLDITLPDQVGEPLIRETLQLCPYTPVIILTGYTDFEFSVRSLTLGVSDYLLKEEITPFVLYKSILYSAERKKIAFDLETSEKRVRSFALQLNNAIEEERSRIAREIHDEFGQQLTGMKMSLVALEEMTVDRRDMGQLVRELQAQVDEGIGAVRHIANELRPAILDKLGLVAAIEWLLSDFEKKTRARGYLYVTHKGRLKIDDKNLSVNLFRICQEAVTNVVKHAMATILQVFVRLKGTQLLISISDNGRGIPSQDKHRPLSMGLLNMQERAALIGAELSIEGSPGKGTIIEIKCNLYGDTNIDS
jgi:signal transduction histidine kinase